MKNKCIQFKNSSNGQELYFYGDIVYDDLDKWTDLDTCPQDVQNILGQIDQKKPLDIYINSGGGSVFGGLAIYNMLKRNPCSKTVHIDGVAGSISSVIAMAGDKIVMPSNAFLMIHKPSCMCAGNANDMRTMADDMDKLQQGIMNVYAEKLAADVDISTIEDMVNAETWIVGSEASKYFNVEVVQSNKAVASIGNLSNYKNVPKELKNTDNNNDLKCSCSECDKKDSCKPNSDGCCCKDCTSTDCTKGNDADTQAKTKLEVAKAKVNFELLF